MNIFRLKLKPVSLFFLLSLASIHTHSQITFSPHIQIQNAGIISFCLSDDFNNDNLNDLVTASEAGRVNVLWIYKQQNGQLILHDTIKYTNWVNGVNSISSGDLNNDGLRDLIIAYGDTLNIYFQDSIAGFFKRSHVLVLRPDSNHEVYGLACGDLNNDGICDFAITYWDNNNLDVFYQNVNHTFNRVTYYKKTSAKNEIIISDINNDGLNDLVVSNGIYTSGMNPDANRYSFAIYIQNTISKLLEYPLFYAIDPTAGSMYNPVNGIAIGDLNNDGLKDIVTTSKIRQQSDIWYQASGNSTFFPNPSDSLGTDINPEPVYIADFNNDGKNEIVICSGGWERVAVYESDVNFIFSNYTLVNLWNTGNMVQGMMSVSDLNNDHLLDIVTTYSYGASIVYNTSLNSVSETQFLFNVAVYPNPSDGKFTIQSGGQLIKGPIEIFNTLGDKVFERHIFSSLTEDVNLKNVTAGVYFVRVAIGEKQYLQKIIVH